MHDDISIVYLIIKIITYFLSFSKILQCEEQLGLMRAACAELRECSPFSKLLQAVLELGNYLNAGTQRGAAAGFKLDTLLKLADVKGVDRKTSLLQFVVQQMQGSEPGINNMAQIMPHVRPAATMQLSAVSAIVGEIRLGLRNVEREVDAAREAAENMVVVDNEDGGDEAMLATAAAAASKEAALRFADAMAAFHSKAAVEFAALVAEEGATQADLRSTCEYFGEEFAVADPVRVVRTVRDFLLLLDKAVFDIAARVEKEAEAAKKAARLAQLTKAKEAKREKISDGVVAVVVVGNKHEEKKEKNVEDVVVINAAASSLKIGEQQQPVVVADVSTVLTAKSEDKDGGNAVDPLLPDSPVTPQMNVSPVPSPCKDSPRVVVIGSDDGGGGSAPAPSQQQEEEEQAPSSTTSIVVVEDEEISFGTHQLNEAEDCYSSHSFSTVADGESSFTTAGEEDIDQDQESGEGDVLSTSSPVSPALLAAGSSADEQQHVASPIIS